MQETEKKKTPSVYALSLIAFVLGIIAGYIIPGMFTHIEFLGTVYVNLLKMIVIPLLMAEIVCTAAKAADAGKKTVRTIILFAAMFVFTYLLTALVVNIIKPGVGVNLFQDEWTGTPAATSIQDFFVSIVPSSIFTAMAEGSMLPCILFSFAFGLAARKTNSEKLIGVMEDLRAVCRKILSWIMNLTPLGVFALIGNSVAKYGAEIFGVCARYILCAWLCFIITMILVMMLPVCFIQKISPVTYIKRMCKVWIVSLSTCSSAATLPTTIRVCNEDFGVPEDVTGMVVPLGCTIHMCGGAVSFCLLGLFTMQMAGMAISLPMFLYMLLVATLINMAAPGIPGGGIVIGATYLTILGAPTGFIAVYSGIYRILDMAYTTMNVSGDVTANVIISRKK